MNSLKTAILLVVLVGICGLLIYIIVGREDNNTLPGVLRQTGNAVSVSPTPTPTPTPVVFDSSSNLDSAAENLTPDDFSKDYTDLKEEAGKL